MVAQLGGTISYRFYFFAVLAQTRANKLWREPGTNGHQTSFGGEIGCKYMVAQLGRTI